MTTKPIDEGRAIREGDIYSWIWSDPKRNADCGSFGAYHCYSRLAVVRNGKLMDTYWHGSDNKILDPASVTLTFLGNTAELVEIRPYDIAYYRREDIVDMRHSNNSHGPIYRRKDAERDAATMLEIIEHRLECSKREIEFAQRRIEQLTKDAKKVRAGKLSEVYL